MKRFLFNMLFILMVLPIFGQHIEVEGYDLPNESIKFLRTYYNNYNKYGTPIYLVEYDDYDSPFHKIDEFEVHFVNGTIIEFDTDGRLKSIDCGKDDVVPFDIIPSIIRNALRQYSRNLEIVEYSIERGRLFVEYEIELKNGQEFVFNKRGKLKE